MTTPPPPTDPNEVRVCIGHHEGAHVRLKGARLVNPTWEGHRGTGTLPPDWTRLYVFAYRDDGKGRLLVFEPAPGESAEWQFRGFYVRGAFREVERDNNPRRARERFEAVPGE